MGYCVNFLLLCAQNICRAESVETVLTVKKYTIDKADSDKGDFKGIQSFQENSRKAVSCSRILQWISNLKRPRIKHQGARIIARCPATYICVSFPDRSSAAGPHNQSIIIKARSKRGYKTDSEVWRFRKFGV